MERLAEIEATETDAQRAATARRMCVVTFSAALPAPPTQIPRLYAEMRAAEVAHDAAVSAHNRLPWEIGCDDTTELRQRLRAYEAWGAACAAFVAAAARAVAPGQWLSVRDAIHALQNAGVVLDAE